MIVMGNMMSEQKEYVQVTHNGKTAIMELGDFFDMISEMDSGVYYGVEKRFIDEDAFKQLDNFKGF